MSTETTSARVGGSRLHWSYLSGALLVSTTSFAGGTLPVPCVPGSCGSLGPSKFITSGNATATQSGGTLTVNQTSNQAALNWSSFDIAAGNKVVFNQPSSSATALNRIYSASPTAIFGNLQANGQIYLINLNGFLFGKTATVNVNNLLVSSLPMSDATFQNGILAPLQSNSAPALGSQSTDTDASFGVYAKDPFVPYGTVRPAVLDLSGNPVLDANGKPIPVQIQIEQGAQISAADGGRLLFAGQSVTNGGSLSAPDGQVILAAGQNIFLQASSDPTLRGLVVEVDSGTSAANQVTNQATGAISTPRGNVTLVGLAVNQDGLISATTSVAANGSIRLEAADTVQFGGAAPSETVSSTHGGTLTIGASSDMTILPELASSATEVGAQPQLQSSVTLLGEQVIMQGGTITAPSGKLTVTAAANPESGVATDGNSAARLRIDPGTTIDLAGSQATLPISANLVSVQLRANELADDPTQRNGPLRGQTVVVDVRNIPPNSLANVSAEVAAVPQNVAQRTENGGSATFQSEGDIVVATNTSINVSGGQTTYLGGQMQTSELIGADGKLYPIATANPLMTYVGVINPTFTQTYNTWGIQTVQNTPGLSRYEPGYVQGASAGSVQFAAQNIVLNGQLTGTAVNGPYQRTPTTAVSGGTLTIGLPGGLANVQGGQATDYLAPAVSFVATPAPVVVADDTPLTGSLTLQLPVSYLSSNGFTNTQIFSNYGVTLPAGLPLSMLPGSSLSIEASRVDIASSITAPAGSLSFGSDLTVGTDVPGAPRGGVYISNGVTLDVRGQWTNDLLSANTLAGEGAVAPTWQNGGSISFALADEAGYAGTEISIGNDVALLASGGAWLEANHQLVGGQGGAISINAGAVQAALAVGSSVSMQAFGVNGATGGSFKLNAPRVDISNGTSGSWTTAQTVDDLNAPGGVFTVYTPLFSSFGFNSININAGGLVVAGAATSNVLSVAPGTTINAVAETLELAPSFWQHPTGGTVQGFASIDTLPAYQRFPVNVTLSTVPPSSETLPGAGTPSDSTPVGNLEVGTGAAIVTPATGNGTGSINLTTENGLLVEGSLIAPGGTVTLRIVGPGNGQDFGFLPNQTLELAPQASIDVAGTLVSQPNDSNLALGTVYAGGTINMLAARGAVQTDPGSSLSIAGASAPLDVLQPNGSYVYTTVASAGGAASVQSGEAISLLGTLNAHAGVGSSGTLAAGSLSVALTQSESWWVPGANPTLIATFSNAPLTIDLVSQTKGQQPASSASNSVALGIAELDASGIDALTLEAGSSINFQSSVPLTLGRSLTLNSPVFQVAAGTNGSVSAPYVSIGSSLAATAQGSVNPPVASGGTGTLSVSAGELDILGTSVVQGAGNVSLTSSGDMRLLGTYNSAAPFDLEGSFSVGGNLSLAAARIYPNTGDVFSISAGTPGSGGAINISQTNPNPGTPLSAAAALTLSADTISSTGTLLAPFGTITFNATDSVTLGAGSLTSVSGDGLTIPYGQTQNGGLQWIYLPTGATSSVTVSGVPARAVTLTSANVTIAPHATVDVSGGGDLSAYEWVPGTGGTQDALAPNVIPGLYAIVPSLVNQLAPADSQEANGSTLAPNASIYWSGGGGLAAGLYPLLPARYALLPDAFLVQTTPGYQSVNGGVVGSLADGTPIVAGYLTYGNTGLHQTSGYTGFSIRPGSYGEQLADYNISLASTFFGAAAAAAGEPRPTLPQDAGTLLIAVGNTLDAGGTVLTSAGTGGLGATIDVSATNLFVGTNASATPSGATFLSDAVLNSWKPGSLLLGGESTSDGGIDVTANRVTLGSGASVTADQVIIVAAQSIDVQAGASLSSTSAAPGGSAPASLPATTAVTLSGNGGGNAALLAVSDLALPIVNRAPGQSGGGSVDIEGSTGSLAGATVASRGALSIDGPGGVELQGTLSGSGAAWSLGSSSIAFSSGTSSNDALTLSPAITQQLGAAGSVRLASSGSIDLLTPVNLGLGSGSLDSITSASQLTLSSLTLSASAINNQAAGSSSFGARDIVLEGVGSGGTASAGSSGSTLQLAAGELDVGPGTLLVNGFGATQAKVFGAVVGQGNGSLTIGGNVSIAAGEVTASTGSQTFIGASGLLSVTAVSGASADLPSPLAGDLTLSGQSLDISGNVTVPAGLLTLQSAGATTIDSGATLSVAGTPVTIVSQTFNAPGGALTVEAGGALTISAGATLDASGAGSANAGAVSLSSGGLTTIDPSAVLAAQSTAGGTGGTFALDAYALSGGASSGLTNLANQLTAGGFTHQIGIRAQTGNLTLGAGAQLTANSVTIDADAGEVTIAGLVSAPSGSQRGSLRIFGGTGVELTSGATLESVGLTGTGLGGNIEIGTGALTFDASGNPSFTTGTGILLDAGSTISTVGSVANGTLLLRAPALTATNDVAIGAINSTLSGIGSLTVEPVMAFGTSGFSNPTAPTAADWSAVQSSIATYMSAASTTIASRLGSPGGLPVSVEAGAEIVAQGDLTIGSGLAGQTALDLSSAGSNWRFGAGNTPVDLTVVATGNLTVAGTITDGFTTDSVHGTSQPVLLNGPSSSIRLIAGADLTSADPLNVASGGTGTLAIGDGAVVRTGTGEIDLVAAGDVTVGANGAGAYTAGLPAVAAGGTASDPYPNVPSALGVGTSYGIQVNPSKTSAVFSFPTGGGQLLVRAGADVVGTALAQASVSNWELREGGATYEQQNPDGTQTQAIAPAQWGVNLAAYNWNFGTLGGGDLTIDAGRDILNVTGAAADSRIANGDGTATLVSSGGLSVFAGRNIGTAQLFLADGKGSVTADGALTAIVPVPGSGGSVVGSAFYLQDSSMSVQARLGISVDGLYNPTALGQPVAKGVTALSGSYFSYGPGAGISLISSSGDVQIVGAGSTATTETALLGSNVVKLGAANASVFPGTLSAVALDGDVLLGGTGSLNASMFPDPNGQLVLAASGDVTGGNRIPSQTPNLIMSDAPLAGIPTIANPSASGRASAEPFDGVLHSDDPTPALIVAGQDVLDLGVSIPKQADILAGRDIDNFAYAGQNINPTDVTLVSAGRDIVYQDACTGSCGMAVGGPGQLDLVAGRNVDLAFSSGITTQGNIKNPNLPTATGADLTIVAGAATQPNYSATLTDLISATNTAADLQALAGVPGVSASGFSTAVTNFLSSVVANSPAYEWDFEYFVRNFVAGQTGTDPGALTFAQAKTLYAGFTPTVQSQWLAALKEVMQASGTEQTALVNYVENIDGASNLSFANALTSFAALTPTQQRNFTDQVFFNELTASGLDDNVLAGVGFSRGYAAIDAFFPGSRSFAPDASGNPYDGDITLVFSRIYTLSGGNISMVAPGGLVNVGLANPPPSLSSRDPSTLGIVAEGSGDVSIYSAGDVLVNASRIFTLGGGNILIWSNEGSIDAGRGSKAAVSAPPPQLLINADGTVTLSFSGAATGSGIRTIQTDPSVPLGNVSLIAPVGTVNAGDAGIGAAGNINIAAQHVLGLDNIQFGGTSTGVPAQVSSLGATLSAVSSAANGTTQASTESVAGSEAKQATAAPLAETALSWLDVFVTGFGEEACGVDDVECLKRQKHP